MERHERQVDSEQAIRKMMACHEPKITPNKKNKMRFGPRGED